MHNWRLLILLIPSLLQPILSEHSYIYGRQYCIHSSRSLADERFLNGKHRFGKPTSNGERPTEQFGIRRYRYDVKDVEPIRFSSEQHLERSIIVSDDRNPIVDVRRSRDVRREIIREQNYKNFRNARNIVTSLYARLPQEDRERESREHSGHRFDTRLDTRASHIRYSRQEILERIGKSNDVRKNYVLARNFRNEHPLNRQRHRDLNLQTDNVPQENRNTDSLERNIRKRDLDGDLIRDITRTETPTDLRRERVNIRNNERNDIDRARNRDTVRSKRTLNSDITNKLVNRNNHERYSRANFREKALVSIENHNRQFNVRQINDRQVISDRDAASSALERDNRQYGGRYTFPNQKSNIILNIDHRDERNKERSLRRIIRERTESAERFVSQSDDSMITDILSVNREETNRNKRDVRTTTRNGRMYSRNNILERDNFAERDMHRSDTRKMNTRNANKSEERTDLRSKRTEIRNAQRRARDNYREEIYNRDTRQYRTERISEKQLSSRQDAPNNSIKYEHTDNRNSERYSRDIVSDRSSSVEREGLKLDSRLALDLSTARSRNERELNTRVDRIRSRNDERHSREHIRERTISNEHDNRQTESKRVSDVRSPEVRSREVRDEGTNNKNINRHSRAIINRRSLFVEPNHLNQRRILRSDIVRINRNVQNIRSDIRNGEKYSSEKDFDEREILRSGVRRINDENDTKNYNERNIRVRVERADVRYAERYVKGDNNRERTLTLNRDVRERDMSTDRHLNHNRNERNINIDHQRTDIRYSNDNTRGRSVSVDREVRDLNVRRVTDLQNHRSREERNIYVRNKRYDIRDHERYSRDVSHERTMLMERSEDGRQPLTMRIEDRQITRGKELQNLNARKERNNVRYVRDDRIRDRSTRFNGRELRDINDRRILRNQMTMNDDNRSYSRNREQNFRDFTYERVAETVERDRTVDNGKLQGLRHLKLTERRTERDQIRNRDNLTISPRVTRNHRISQEQIRNTDNVRSSDAHVSESRRATLDLYRDREIGIREGFRSSRNINTRRDYVSRQNSEFTNAFRTTTRADPTMSAIKPTEKQFNAMFYWQYIFYAVQGIYIFGVLIQVFKEKDNSKASSMGWLIPTRLVKVD